MALTGCVRPGQTADWWLPIREFIAPEAIAAAGQLAEQRRDLGVLAITSADRLNAGWTAAQRERARGNAGAISRVERLLNGLPSYCSLVTVIDGHPATLAWLGAVAATDPFPTASSTLGRPVHLRISTATSASIVQLGGAALRLTR